MKVIHGLLVGVSIGLGWSGIAGADTSRDDRDASSRRSMARQELLYSSTVIGETVENERGESIGSIKDLVINPNTGKVEFGVVTVSAGFLGIGGKTVMIPWDQFRLNATRRGYQIDVRRAVPADEPVTRVERRRVDVSPGQPSNAEAPVVESPELKHFRGKLMSVDPETHKVQVKRLLTTETFNCGTIAGTELNRLRVGDEVDVAFRNEKGINLAESIQPVTN